MKYFVALLLVFASFGCNQSAKPNLPLYCENTRCTIDTNSCKIKLLSERLDSFYEAKHKAGCFNGCVAVSLKGTCVYQRSFGYSKYDEKEENTSHTSFQLASVSKTFTSTAVMYLVDKGLLQLNDSIQKFFPDFPYKKITVQQLLSHRSGLPNYLYFAESLCKSNTYIYNTDVIDYMTTHRPAPEHLPGKHFMYCNTNFLLLASIVEKVTGTKFKNFMHDTFFEPLGMANTFVLDAFDTTFKKPSMSYNSKWVIQKDDCFDGVVGDKGIYSCTEDMMKWDKAFYEGKLLSQNSMTEAYTPRSFEKPGNRNYGYGWRLLQQSDKSYLVYHNGWWHGNNTVYYRNTKDTSTVVVLNNKFSRDVYNLKPVWQIIYGTTDSLSFEEQ
jgi:CubicO group peptidase (beta-lactamase class C family)